MEDFTKWAAQKIHTLIANSPVEQEFKTALAAKDYTQPCASIVRNLPKLAVVYASEMAAPAEFTLIANPEEQAQRIAEHLATLLLV